MITKEEIIKIIEDKIIDIMVDNNRTRMFDEYYVKNDAKIEVLEEVLRLIEQSE